MKRRTIRYRGYEVKIGDKMTYENMIITLTDQIVEDNPEHFIVTKINLIAAFEDQLLKTDDSVTNSMWESLKRLQPRLYYLKILQMMAEEGNKKGTGMGDKHFIYRTTDQFKEIKLYKHSTVCYNIVYFNRSGDATRAIEMLGEDIKYVV